MSQVIDKIIKFIYYNNSRANGNYVYHVLPFVRLDIIKLNQWVN